MAISAPFLLRYNTDMSPTQPIDRRPPLDPPRFRLRTLMWLVALACVLVAIMTSLSAYGVFAAVLTVLAIAGHLIGAALGHRLRDHGDRPLPTRTTTIDPRRPVGAHEFAPATKLSQYRGPGKWVLGNTVVWCVLGAIMGGVLMAILCGEKTTLANVSAGAIAFSVLGALWGFALGAFVQELASAWWDAQK